MNQRRITHQWGLKLVLILALVLFVAPTLFTSAVAAPSCQVVYTISNQWNTGFTANVAITNNTSTPIQGWTLTWSYANGQQITGAWNATVTQSGANVTASNPASNWNGTIGANGGSVSFGFQGNYSVPCIA